MKSELIAIGQWMYRWKKIYPILILILMSQISSAELKWDETTLVLQPKQGDKTATGVYRFINNGTNTVNIVDCSTSCGCTVAALEKKTYAPGEKGEIPVTFKAGGRQGRQTKLVIVKTDEAYNADHTLKLVVDIPELFTVSQAFLTWTKGEARSSKSIDVKVPADQGVRLLDVKMLPEDGKFKAELIQKPDKPETYQLEVTPPAEGATLLSEIRIRTTLETIPYISIYVQSM